MDAGAPEEVDVAGAAPAAACQVRMLQEVLRRPASAQFNISIPLRVRGLLAANRLEAAVLRTLARHSALRTDFQIAGGQLRQIPIEPVFALRRVEAPEGDERFRDGAVAAIVRAEMSVPVAALGGRLLRGLLIRRAADDHVLVLTFHHLGIDGRSARIFLTDLTRAYDSLSGGSQPALREAATQFAAACGIVDAPAGSREWTDDVAFWTSELTADRPDDTLGLAGGRPRRVVVRLPDPLSARARSLAERAGTSLPAVYLAGILRWAHGRSGGARRRVAVQVDRRTSAALDSTVGPLVTTMPLAFNPDAASSEGLATYVQDRLNDGYLHLGAPIEAAIAAWSATPAAVGDPGPRLLFSFDRPYAPPPRMTGLQWSGYPHDRRWAPVPEAIAPYEAIVNTRIGDADASLELISGGADRTAAARGLIPALSEMLAES